MTAATTVDTTRVQDSSHPLTTVDSAPSVRATSEDCEGRGSHGTVRGGSVAKSVAFFC